MIGDRLIIEDIHWLKANRFQSQIEQNSVVLIGGSSGSGKSECADCIQYLLYKRNLTSLVLSMDDFYLIKPTLRRAYRIKTGIDSVGIDEIDWIDLNRIREDFFRKRVLKFQRFHRYASVTEYDQIDSNRIDVIIFEGLFVNYLKKYNEKNLSIYLEGNMAQTYDFRLKRKKENPDDKFRQQVVQKENNVVCQLKRYADIIIPF